MSANVPSSRSRGLAEFLRSGQDYASKLRHTKAGTPLPDYGWYPYESLSALPVIAELIAPLFGDLVKTMESRPVCDLGCADGDFAMLFASMGAPVDAIDHLETNFNQLRGINKLKEVLRLPIKVHDLDLDGRFELPRRDYGLTLFLGTLYHLRNPFFVLEEVAKYSDWCILSTRIAQVTPTNRVRIAEEPVAYLLDNREANNDPTNFWIFSPAGLDRILQRAGWTIMNELRLGMSADSDPRRTDADERVFVLLKSKTRFPELQAWPLGGWHEVENDRWRWTSKRFSLGVALPRTQAASEFALRFTAPEVIFAAGGELTMRCEIDWGPAGSITCASAGTLEFRGRFPAEAAPGSSLRLDFTVDSSLTSPPGDSRELGVIVPLLDAGGTSTQRIPFRIS